MPNLFLEPEVITGLKSSIKHKFLFSEFDSQRRDLVRIAYTIGAFNEAKDMIRILGIEE